MGEGIRIGSGGKKATTIVNAIIAEYMAQSGEISMDNFVEFVRSGSLTQGNMTSIFSYDNESNIVFPGHVIPIDESHALLVWAVNSIAILVKVSNLQITVVKQLSFATPSVNTRTAFAVVGDGRVMLVRSDFYSNDKYRIQGCILTINAERTTISSGGWKDILVASYSSDYFYNNPAPAVVMLRENEVAIVYAGTSGGFYFANVLPVAISGTDFIAKTAVTFFKELEDNTNDYVTGIEVAALTPNNIIIALQVSFAYNSSLSYVWCYRCVISDALVATVSNTYLNLGSYTALSSLKRINDTYAVIVYTSGEFASGETRYLYMATVRFSGSTIAVGAAYTLDSRASISSSDLAGGVANSIGDGYVVAVTKAYGYASFYVKLFTLSGSSLVLKQTLTFSTQYSTYSGVFSLPMTVGEHVLISFGADYSSYYAIPFQMKRLLKLATTKIDGVTETTATTSTAGKVSIINKWGE